MNKLIFGDIEVSKKQFYESKKGIIKGNNEVVKYYVGYMDDFVSSLCLILPHMSGWIKYF